MNSGDSIGQRYRLDRKIGQGGTGRIWLAQDTRLDRSVAIKFLTAGDPERRARLMRRVAFEAKIAASVQHRNVVQIFDFGAHDDTPYIVMEALTGYTLGEAFDAAETFSLDALVHILSEVLRGLSAVHDAGIVHRDLKPDNIFLVQESREKLSPKLLDFGISRSLDETRHSAVTTTEGLIVGTPQYMSPEQARGVADIDQRTDIYSLGTIMFEAFAGVVPFPAKNISELLIAVIQGEAQSLYEREPRIGKPLCAVVDRALRKDREARYAHAAQMLDALLAAAQQVPPGLDRSAPLFPPEVIKLRASNKAPYHSASSELEYPDLPLAQPVDETWLTPAMQRRRQLAQPTQHEAITVRSDEPPPQLATPHILTPAAVTPPAVASGAPLALRYGVALGALTLLGVAVSAAVIMHDRSAAVAGTGMIVVQAPQPLAAPPPPAPSLPATTTPPPSAAPEPEPAPVKKITAHGVRKPAGPQDPMQLAAASVADAFARQKARVIDCLSQHPDDIEGTPQLTLRVSLDEAGKVTNTEVLPESLSGKPVVACVRAMVTTMSFPKPEKAATFRVPLSFRRK